MAEVFTRVVRPVILGAARSNRMRRAAERIPVTRKVVERFVAGETVPEVVGSVAQLRDSGRTVTIDYLGEDTTKIEDAQVTVRAYLELLDSLGKRGEPVDTKVRPLEVSLKLSALGQALPRDGEKIALENARTICERAKGIGAWVTVDAEDHTTTDSTLSIVRELRTEFDWLGTVLQSYLKRTHADCEEFAASGARIRLCKGAYDEPASVAYRDPDDVDDSYLRCLRVLMAGTGYPMVASHDPRIIEAVPAMARENQPRRRRFRIPDALRHPGRRTAPAVRGGQPGAGVRAIRHRVVRLLRASSRRTPGEPDVLPAGTGRTRH